MDKTNETRICYNCKKPSQFSYRNKLTICGECFSYHVCNRGFRSSIRNNLKLSGKTNFLIHHFDFSLNSIMIAHFLNQNSTENQVSQKKMFFDSLVVFIDFSFFAESVFPNVNRAYFDKLNSDFIDLMKSLVLKHEIIKIEDFLDIKETTEFFLQVPISGDYRDDFIKILEKRIILQYCFKKKINKVLLNENLEQLATRSLKLLCKSRQNEIVSQCSETFSFDFDGCSVVVLRPLVERSQREIYYYTYFNKIIGKSLNMHEWFQTELNPKHISLPGKGSLNNLLSEFIFQQQSEFIATASNVQQTIEKLKESKIDKRSGNKFLDCRFCKTVK